MEFVASVTAVLSTLTLQPTILEKIKEAQQEDTESDEFLDVPERCKERIRGRIYVRVARWIALRCRRGICKVDSGISLRYRRGAKRGFSWGMLLAVPCDSTMVPLVFLSGVKVEGIHF